MKEKERSIDGAIREIREELGIDVKLDELKHLDSIQDKKNVYNFYLLKRDIDVKNICVQKEEVNMVKWCTKEEIEEIIKNNEFFEKHIDAWKLFKKHI